MKLLLVACLDDFQVPGPVANLDRGYNMFQHNCNIDPLHASTELAWQRCRMVHPRCCPGVQHAGNLWDETKRACRCDRFGRPDAPRLLAVVVFDACYAAIVIAMRILM